MKIGLLECDHVRPEFLPIAGDYRQMFPAFFELIAHDWEWHFYDVVNGQFPANLHECDVYVCTGSKFSVYDDQPWILQLKQFVRQLYESQKTFVGVCFGHQMIGEALGGQVRKADVGWCVGAHEFVATQEGLHYQVPDSFRLLMMCQDQVLSLPPNSKVLATSPDCPNAMLLVGEKIVGIQAHPEFTVAYEEALMRARTERIGPEKTERQLKTLTLPLDGQALAGWIYNFVKYNASPASPKLS